MAKSLKVLHIYSGNRFGGAENYLLTLARNKDLCPQMEHSFALCFEDYYPNHFQHMVPIAIF